MDIPFLAPGQEWRTFWDSGIDREDADLPDRYDLTVTYVDSHGEQHSTPSVLDWGLYHQRLFLVDLGLHEAADSLREIRKILDRWSKKNETLRVTTYDGKQYDQRLQEEAEEPRRETDERRRRHRELVARLLPNTQNGDAE